MSVSDIKEVTARCDFCESSLAQMKKDLIVYLKKKSEITKQTGELAKMLRHVASTERNIHLQECLFNCASTYTELDASLQHYGDCSHDTQLLLEEAQKYLISPMREVILDSNQSLLKRDAKNNVSGITQLDQRLLHQQAVLPVHTRLFETHRVKYMKTILKNMIYAELKYHCSVVELLSPLLTALAVDGGEQTGTSHSHGTETDSHNDTEVPLRRH